MLAQLFKGRRNVFKRRHEKEFQTQPPRDVPMKRCSRNMLRIYRRTPMPKCDIEITLRYGCSPVIYCIFSEHLFLRTRLEGCFWNLVMR